MKPTRLYSTLNWKTPYTSGSLNLAKKKPSAKENNISEYDSGNKNKDDDNEN